MRKRVRQNPHCAAPLWWKNGGVVVWKQYVGSASWGILLPEQAEAMVAEASEIEGWNDPDGNPFLVDDFNG